MKTKKTLVLLALTASLSIGLAAYGANNAETVVVKAPSSTSSSGTDPSTQPTEAAPPTSFADDAAKSALDEVCSKLPLAEVATLLGVPTVERRDGIAEAQDSLDTENVFCSFMPPSADEYGVDGWKGSQTFASVSVARAAVRACEDCTGGTVNFPDSSVGYYSGPDDTALRITPAGSAYELSFSVVLPYEVTTPGGLDRETTDLWQGKAADFAHMALG